MSVNMIAYCSPVLGGSLWVWVFFWQALLVLHYYRACVALGELGCVPFCAARHFSISLRSLLQRCPVSGTSDIQGPQLG